MADTAPTRRPRASAERQPVEPETGDPDTGDNDRLRSLDKALLLLEVLALADEPATAQELARRGQMNRTTAWRILGTLERHGLAHRDPCSQRYALGVAALGLGGHGREQSLLRVAHPSLAGLGGLTKLVVSLAAPRGLELVYIHQVDPPALAMPPNWVGRPVPLHATATGKAFLAWLPLAELDAVLGARLQRFTETTVTARRELLDELGQVRAAGYATARGELEEGVHAVAAAVRDRSGIPIAVVNVWGPPPRVDAEIAELGQQTARAAEAVAGKLEGGAWRALGNGTTTSG
ncbi:MAG: IclR family transcriptional regulator [Acidimicrobiales bacterium]